MAKNNGANVSKLVNLLKREGKNGMVYWVEQADRVYVGTRHYLISTQFMIPEVRAALASFGLYEPGAVNSGRVTTAPDLSVILNHAMDGAVPAHNTNFIHTNEKHGCPLRVISSAGKLHVFTEEYYAAITAAFPHSPLMMTGQMVVWGETLQALLLQIRPTNEADNDFERYMKNPLYFKLSHLREA